MARPLQERDVKPLVCKKSGYRKQVNQPKNRDASTQCREFDNDRFRCKFIKPNGKQCNLLSGVHQKYCVLHGGSHGYAQVLGEGKFSAVYQAFAAQNDALDLHNELALQRTMLSATLAKIKDFDFDNLPTAAIVAVTEMTHAVATIAKTMANIQASLNDTVHVEDIKMVLDSIVEVIAQQNLPLDVIEKIAIQIEQITLPVKTIDIQPAQAVSDDNEGE